MPLIKFGRNHLNPDRIVNVVSPSSQGSHTDAAKVVLAGSDDLILFGEDAEAAREWLDGQVEPPKPAVIVTKVVADKPATAPAPAPVAPVVTK